MAKLQADVQVVLQNEVYSVVKETMQEQIRDDVYGVYNPSNPYVRREGSGGLIADENIVAELDNNGLFVKNITPPDYSYREGGVNPNFNSYPSTYLSQWIENGEIGTRMFGEGVWSDARPFITNTENELERTDKHTDALRQGLHDKGWKTT